MKFKKSLLCARQYIKSFHFWHSQFREENSDNKLAIKIQWSCYKGMNVVSWEDRKGSIQKLAVGGKLSLFNECDLK